MQEGNISELLVFSSVANRARYWIEKTVLVSCFEEGQETEPLVSYRVIDASSGADISDIEERRRIVRMYTKEEIPW